MISLINKISVSEITKQNINKLSNVSSVHMQTSMQLHCPWIIVKKISLLLSNKCLLQCSKASAFLLFIFVHNSWLLAGTANTTFTVTYLMALGNFKIPRFY